MKSTSIEILHNKIQRKILLAESYTEYKDLSFIIRSCRLKPANNDLSLSLNRKWIDEYGNSLNIIKNKRIKIIENDLSIDKNQLICTDLYDGLPIHKIAKVSKLAYVLVGKDEDFQEEHLIIAFLGIDNYLRVYYIYDGQMAMCSPLSLGMKVLKTIAEYKDIRYFIELNNKDLVLFPCTTQKSWISFYPAPQKFIGAISKESDLFSQLLNIN